MTRTSSSRRFRSSRRGKDNFSEFPGFDPLKDTYNSQAIQHVFLPTYPGGGTNADLADGRGADFGFFGANLDSGIRRWLDDQRTSCSSTAATRTPTRCSRAAIPRR